MKSGTLFIVLAVAILVVGGYYALQMQKSRGNEDVMIQPSGEDAMMPKTGSEESAMEDKTMMGDEEEGETMMKDEVMGDAMMKEGVKEFNLENKGLSYTVKEMRVKKGDTVRVTFKVVQGSHDWRLDEFDAATKIMTAGGEETVEFVADKTGEFEYYCSVPGHRAAGMVGKFIVEE